MYTSIDYNLLNENKACGPQMDLIKKHFGLKPIPLTKKVVSNLSSLFDIDWAAKKFLTVKDFIKYKKVISPAAEKYLRAEDKAISQHEVNTKLVWLEYEKILQSNGNSDRGLRKCQKGHEQANVDYYNTCKLARAQYRKVIALEFIKLYKKGMA